MTSVQTIIPRDFAHIITNPSSGHWREDIETSVTISDLIKILEWLRPRTLFLTSVTTMVDPWIIDMNREVRTVGRPMKTLTISDLGWSREKAREVRARLATFAADWDDPTMDIYNES